MPPLAEGTCGVARTICRGLGHASKDIPTAVGSYADTGQFRVLSPYKPNSIGPDVQFCRKCKGNGRRL